MDDLRMQRKAEGNRPLDNNNIGLRKGLRIIIIIIIII
jgi:hypothetical protein